MKSLVQKGEKGCPSIKDLLRTFYNNKGICSSKTHLILFMHFSKINNLSFKILFQKSIKSTKLRKTINYFKEFRMRFFKFLRNA